MRFLKKIVPILQKAYLSLSLHRHTHRICEVTSNPPQRRRTCDRRSQISDKRNSNIASTIITTAASQYFSALRCLKYANADTGSKSCKLKARRTHIHATTRESISSASSPPFTSFRLTPITAINFHLSLVRVEGNPNSRADPVDDERIRTARERRIFYRARRPKRCLPARREYLGAAGENPAGRRRHSGPAQRRDPAA